MSTKIQTAESFKERILTIL